MQIHKGNCYFCWQKQKEMLFCPYTKHYILCDSTINPWTWIFIAVSWDNSFQGRRRCTQFCSNIIHAKISLVCQTQWEGETAQCSYYVLCQVRWHGLLQYTYSIGLNLLTKLDALTLNPTPWTTFLACVTVSPKHVLNISIVRMV